MSTHNIGFYEDLTKIIVELSSNMHLISSAELLKSLTVYYCLTTPMEKESTTVSEEIHKLPVLWKEFHIYQIAFLVS